jgi:hypothetical protein
MTIDNVPRNSRPTGRLTSTAALLAASIAAAFLAVDSSASATAVKPSLSIMFATTSLEKGARALANVCATSVPATWVTDIQEQEGTAHLWTSIGEVTLSGTECKGVSLRQDEPGIFTFRTLSSSGKAITYQSATAAITVYTDVAYQVVCSAQTDCHFANGSGSEEINTHITGYLDQVTAVGLANGQYSYSLKSNSCRTMLLYTVFLHDSHNGSGAPGDSIAIQVVQRTLNAQSATVSLGVPMFTSFNLDGGPVDINVIGITSGEQFVLISGTLSCYTLNGVP